MDSTYIPRLPVPIIAAALEHVRKKFNGLTLDEELLTELYWRIRWRKEQLLKAKRRNRDLKVSTAFYVVRDWVLDQRFPQRHPADQLMRKAYSSALGKIGSEFRKRAQPTFLLKRTPLERIMEHVTLDHDRRQYRLVP